MPQPSLGRPPLALGAVPVAAGVVGDAGVRAVRTLLDVAAEFRGAAELTRPHDTSLREGYDDTIGTRFNNG